MSGIKGFQKNGRAVFAENPTGAVLREMNRSRFVLDQQRERTASAIKVGEFTITLSVKISHQFIPRKEQPENTAFRFRHRIRNSAIVSIEN